MDKGISAIALHTPNKLGQVQRHKSDSIIHLPNDNIPAQIPGEHFWHWDAETIADHWDSDRIIEIGGGLVDASRVEIPAPAENVFTLPIL